MPKKSHIAATGALAAALTFVFCFANCSKQPAAEGGPIKIGVVTTLTGNAASWGDMQKKATMLAVEDVNASGGINGKRVEAVIEDDQGKPASGVSAFNKLIGTTDVPIIVGFPLSGVTLAAAETANREKVILLSSGSTATAVGQAGPYVFRIMPSDEVQAGIMADWAIELGYKRIAVLYVENAWGRGLKDNFVKTYAAKGGTILRIETSTDDASDFRTQLTKIKQENADAIYMPLYQRSAGLAIRQARELGIQQQILGADVYETPELLQAGGTAVNGILYATFGRGEGPAQDAFAKKYQERFGEKPGTYASYSYDVFKIAVEVISSAGSSFVKPDTLREKLLGVKDYQGVTGVTTFADGNSASGKTFVKMTVRDGKFIPWVAASAR